MQEIIPSTYRLKITAIKEETKDAKTFTLKLIDQQHILYQSGQFLTFVFQHSNGKEVRRSYSISSPPSPENVLSITVKKVPNGEFSRKLVDHAQVGDVLHSIGAAGLFTLPSMDKESDNSFCFFAAGSGISPVFALIKTLLYEFSNTSILLIYSNKNASSIIFLEDLLLLKRHFENRFVIAFLFSDAVDLLTSRLTPSVLDTLAIRYRLYEHKNAYFYLCGPHAYMRMIHIKLRAEGVAIDRIKREQFIIDPPQFVLPEPPDKHRYPVHIQIRQQHFKLNVQYPDSILKEAKKQHIPIPYSCETGQCGSCAALCTSGKVWMRYNEVLTEQARSAGYILTCTGYPIEGPVDLRFN